MHFPLKNRKSQIWKIGIFLNLILFGSLIGAGMVWADLVLIVHPGNEISDLTKTEVLDLYMGRYVAFPNGKPALPLDLPVDSAVRAQFYQRITGKSVAQINAYWARIIFTGRATPPRIISDTPSIIRAVRENRDAIAYIDSADLDDSVKVVIRIK